MRNLEAETLARELNFATAEDLRDNLSERNGFIKLLQPIGNIKMISRNRDAQTFEEAQICAQNCGTAGFKDWQLPTLEELELIYKLHEAVPDLFPFTTTFWSSTEDEEDNKKAWSIDFLFCCGIKCQDKSTPNDVILIRREG